MPLVLRVRLGIIHLEALTRRDLRIGHAALWRQAHRDGNQIIIRHRAGVADGEGFLFNRLDSPPNVDDGPTCAREVFEFVAGRNVVGEYGVGAVFGFVNVDVAGRRDVRYLNSN